jgi:hypothetical protein
MSRASIRSPTALRVTTLGVVGGGVAVGGGAAAVGAAATTVGVAAAAMGVLVAAAGPGVEGAGAASLQAAMNTTKPRTGHLRTET